MEDPDEDWQVWQQARSLPDDQAASILGRHFRDKWFPRLTDGEAFVTKRTLREIVFLDPAEARACLAWLRDSHTPPAEWRGELTANIIVTYPEFVDRLEDYVAGWELVHRLLARSSYERQAYKERLETMPPDSKQRWVLARFVIMAEALADPVRAAEWVVQWWGAHPGWGDTDIKDEVLLRLWNNDPNAGLSLIQRLGPSAFPRASIFLLRKLLSLPSSENLLFTTELLRQFHRGGAGPLGATIGYALEALPQWPADFVPVLLEAISDSFLLYEQEHANIFGTRKPKYWRDHDERLRQQIEQWTGRSPNRP